MLAFADNIARRDSDWAQLLFWVCLAFLFIPAALRLLMPGVPRLERIGLVALLGISLYLVKVLHSPVAFDFHDEFLHWRTATNIMQTGHLYSINSLLPISPLYPGLEIATTAFSSLSGWSLYESALILLGIARLVFVLAMFLFFEKVSRSARVAGIAVLVYMANSNFVFFDAQFSYETLALPLAAVALTAIVHRELDDDHSRVRLLLIILPLIAAIAATHHLTGYAIGILLVFWAVTAFLLDQHHNNWQRLGVLALLTVAITWGWTIYVGNATFGYLTPVIRGGLAESAGIILGESSGRELFKGSAGLLAPLWERITGVLSVILLVAVLPLGAWYLWKRYWQNGLALGLAATVLAYPILQIFRITTNGWEIANRSSEFLYWGIAFAAAVGIVGFWPSVRRYHRGWALIFAAWAAIVFAGGVISGWPFWARLPGTYLVSADGRSIEPEGIAAAQWTGAYLGHGNRIAADRDNGLLMGTYGGQELITHLNDNIYISQVYTAPTLGPSQVGLIKAAKARYMLVDERLSTGLPAFGIYFEGGEPGSVERTTPIEQAALAKFGVQPNLSRRFDSGNIKIYDVNGLSASYETP